MDSPNIPDNSANVYDLKETDRRQGSYEQAEFRAGIVKDDIKAGMTGSVWEWTNEPITVTKKYLTVGEKVRLKKKRRIF